MEEVEDHWRDKDFVRIVSVLDIILGVLIFGFQLSRLFVTDIIFPIAATSNTISIIISLTFWIFIFVLNILQIYVAFKLFVQVNQEEPEITPPLQAARVWFKLSAFLLTFVFVKVFIFLLLADQTGKTFGWILLVLEMFLRVAGLYFTREFIDDLRTELAQSHLHSTNPNSTANSATNVSVNPARLPV